MPLGERLARLFGAAAPARPDPSLSAPIADVKPIAWLAPEEESLVPPRDLWIGPDDSISHYYRWIWEYLAYLTLVARLERKDAVLDLGCGHGRLARGLLEYIRSPGRYVGLDVHAASIADARERFTSRWPNFEFVWADVKNGHSNPTGAIGADQFTFPFPDGSFDVVFAASLFTHLLPAETERYFAETRRVLKPDGKCLFSVFLLDRYKGPGSTTSAMYEFDHQFPGAEGVAVRDPDFPHSAIAYNEGTLRRFAERAGLAIERVLPGLWSQNGDWAVNEHDLIVLAPATRLGTAG